MIGCKGLEAAVAASKIILSQLQSEHPNLNAFLVLVHRGQQTQLTAVPSRILKDCDHMIVSDDNKREVLRLQSEMERLEAASTNHKSVQQLSRALAERERELRIIPEVQIEIRFHVLRYALVWALQESQWIDRKLTTKTKASIRIVLGTIDHLSRKGNFQES